MKSIGENIRGIRESKKISQYAVAYSMDMSQAAYSKIERGETEVKASHLYKLAAILNVSVYDLLPPSVASSFEGNDYLVKSLITWLKMKVYGFMAKRRLKKTEQPKAQ
ncbi:helix-turn-helix transcriptional regulator [uncultured Pedobacter sp.]|uniref:helix-turn-helix domain-containing protein n=1 Tax=uncultured Pedobacter sp. TaxID=246139 RepID=UPI00260EC8C8|nr:helix-turn-helix transcriptional regulator [uncultured Pedobacter sp.]